MKTLRLEIELEYDDEIMHGSDAEAVEWFREKVLLNPDKNGLILHSNEIGDEVGRVRVLKIRQQARCRPERRPMPME